MGFTNGTDADKEDLFPKKVIRWNDKFAKAGLSPKAAIGLYLAATKKAVKESLGRESILNAFVDKGVQFGYHDYGNGKGVEESEAFFGWVNQTRSKLVKAGLNIPDLQRGGTGRTAAVDIAGLVSEFEGFFDSESEG